MLVRVWAMCFCTASNVSDAISFLWKLPASSLAPLAEVVCLVAARSSLRAVQLPMLNSANMALDEIEGADTVGACATGVEVISFI